MTYREVLEKVENYRLKMIDEYCQNNDGIEFKKGEVICRQQFINGNRSFKEYDVVTEISLDNDGKLKGYKLSSITPKGRVSKARYIYWCPCHDSNYTCSDGRKVKEVLSHHYLSLNDYNNSNK